MARPVTPLGTLGADVASALDDVTSRRLKAIDEARRGFLEKAVSGRPRAKGQRVPIAFAFAALVVMLAVAFGVGTRRVRPIQFSVDGAPGAVQTWLAAPEEKPLVVRFSEGSTIRVEPLSRARVVETTERGAAIALENGTVHADVLHTKTSAWQVIAGPFTVRVTGTRFDARWDSTRERFAVMVQEGSVVVEGSVAGTGHPIVGGHELRAFVREHRLEVVELQASASQASSATATAGNDPTADASREDDAGLGGMPPESPSSVSPGPASKRPPALPSWRDLAKSGDMRGAFSAAEAFGFTDACNSANAAELLVLGDAARIAGNSSRAVEALLALRRRFPTDPRRASAAFALGKVAFDQRHAYAEAALWFSTSLRELPQGPLAREAAGRLIEAKQRSGDARGAEQAAREYLLRYPEGPHAALARSLVGG